MAAALLLLLLLLTKRLYAKDQEHSFPALHEDMQLVAQKVGSPVWLPGILSSLLSCCWPQICWNCPLTSIFLPQELGATLHAALLKSLICKHECLDT